MVRASASKSSTEKVTNAPSSAAAEKVVPSSEKVAAAVDKAEKVKKAPKAKKAVEESVVTEVPAVVAPVDASSLPVDPLSLTGDAAVLDKSTLSGALLAEIADFNKNFQEWTNFGNALKNNVKTIAKISSRVSKNADKSSKRKKNAKSRPSGFEKPTLISDELAVFFGRDIGTLMARTDVSKQIHEYVIQQKLQNEKNRRIIHPDAKLKKLLNVNNDELTYFNLQKYLKFHFQKDVAAVAAAPVVAKA
jgi:chromatin remodeling complex protein RSC6